MAKGVEKLPTTSDFPNKEDPLAHELSKRLSSIVGKEQRAQVIAQVMSVVYEERFSGPIAHPKHLREYEEICPGSADRIVTMAENQLSHAQAMQDKALDADISDMRQGRILGFCALILLIIGAIISAYLNKDSLALAFLGAGALGTIGTIVKGRGGRKA